MGAATKLKDISRRLTDRSGAGDLRPFQSKLEAINNLEPRFQRLNDSELRQQADQFKNQAATGMMLSELLVEVFALVREIAVRTTGLRPYDVQMLGGIGLDEGRIVQMQTGEGKTLAAVAPICLNALSGKGVHVLTFNDYLASRDAMWMGPIYQFFGLKVAYIDQSTTSTERKTAYEADVTYLTAKEAGFDFLRDGLAYETEELVQRPFHMAVIDEADSILIDEARIPLILAGVADKYGGGQERMNELVEQLEPGLHFSVDEGGRSVYLTEEGGFQCERLLDCGELYSDANLQNLTELNLALHAHVLMRRDVDYIVRQGRVEIVDDFTGRVMEDRHWPFGLQAAIEVKEGLQTSKDARVLSSITIQHFVRQYPSLCGMTATAEPAADELFKFYELELLVIPPNRPCVRIDHPDCVISNREAKHQALIEEIKTTHARGRPVLVGTITVEESEMLASRLKESGIACNILNATRDDQEARIIAEAGDIRAVTISTNMAGRGTDIKLGGQSGERYDQVRSLGGLYVLGTNRHESSRIDYQLRGRAGRQGDPGSSRLFVSLEDDLLVRYGLDDLLPRRFRSADQSESFDNAALRRAIEHAQRVIEGQNFDIRDALWRYSRVVEYQRRIKGENRRSILWWKTRLNLLQERAATKWEQASLAAGEPALRNIERRIMLLSIDECWSEHLERITNIQDGIHLAHIGGMDPLIEFQKEAASSYELALRLIDERLIKKFNSLEITSPDVALDEMGLRGPSSTWTYLVSDNTYMDRLAITLVSSRHIGFAANAALLTPIILVTHLLSRLRRRRR
jgi:preprotein translocase subunit SecA